jgi:hypothetical protein
MNNSPERRAKWVRYLTKQNSFDNRQPFALCCCTNRKNFLRIKKRPVAALRKIILPLDGSCSRSNTFHSSHPNWLTLNSPHKKHDADKYEEEGTKEA